VLFDVETRERTFIIAEDQPALVFGERAAFRCTFHFSQLPIQKRIFLFLEMLFFAFYFKVGKGLKAQSLNAALSSHQNFRKQTDEVS
jgi:hypothetical protein